MPVCLLPPTAAQRALRLLPALLLTALVACSKSPSAAAPGATPAAAAAPPPPQVQVLKVQLGPVPLTQELPGRLEAARSAQVRARANGIVQQRLFAEGSQVRAGQLLFRIDASNYTAAAQSAQAQLAKAQASLELAAAQRQRYEALGVQMAVSKNQLDVVRAAEKSAQAEVRAARAALANAQVNLGQTTVAAPISGVIGRALVSEGALVSQTEATPLAIIQQTHPLYVNFTQSAAQALALRRAHAAHTAGTPVELVLEDGSVYAQPGRLLFTDMAVDSNTGQVNLRAQVPNPQGLLFPGLFVRVRIVQGQAEQALRLPQPAVTRGTQGDTVLVVAPDGSFAPRPVQIAAALGNDWVITSGLQNGEQVIVQGQMKLMPNVKKVQAVPYVPAEGLPSAAASSTSAATAPTALTAPTTSAAQVATAASR